MMQNFSFIYAPFPPAFMFALAPLFLVAIVWIIAIKGFALWHAARYSQKEWFVALLVINTLGILEVIYLLWFRPAAPVAPPSTQSSPQADTK